MWIRRCKSCFWPKPRRSRLRRRFFLYKRLKRRGAKGEQEIWESAVLDRIVDGRHAVLLVGAEQVERIVPVQTLGRVREGDWLLVRFCGQVLVAAKPDPVATQRARERIAQKLARLRQRGRPASS